MKPVFFRSSGVLNAYMILKKINVEKRAYSKSRVALKAMSMRDVKRNALFSKSVMRRSGTLNAFPEKRPWYKIIRENNIGWVRMKTSAGPVMGLKRLATFTILIT